MPSSYDDDLKFFNSLPESGPKHHEPEKTGGLDLTPPETNMQDEPLREQFRTGLKQGFLGYAEAPAYYAEKGIRKFAPNFRINPFGIRDWAKAYRERAESTGVGIAGEMTGTLAPLLLPGIGELGFAARAGMGAEDLARMTQLARAAKTGESAVGGLKLTGIEQAPLAQRAINAVSGALGPAGRGAIRGGIGSVMAQPATTPEEFKNQLLTGAILGAGGRSLGRNIPRVEAEFRGGGRGAQAFRRARTPESEAAELRKVMEGETGPSMMQRIKGKIPRTLGHAIGHPLGHALMVPGGGFVGGHALAGLFEAIARGGRSGKKAEGDLLRLARRAARKRRAGRAAGPLGEILAPAAGYPVPYDYSQTDEE